MTESAAPTSTPGLDVAVISRRLATLFDDDRWVDLGVQLITGGKSNLTYRLNSPAGSVVLRRPPTGKLLPKAHDMSREARVQQALNTTDVPVPQIYLFEQSPDLLGAPFYVMQDVPGVVVDATIPPGYASTPEDKHAMGVGLIDSLIKLHQVDPDVIGLGDYGRPEGFLERQIRTWGKQWELSKTTDIPAMEELRAGLSQGVPSAQRTTIVHGDFKLNNLLLDPDDPGQVNAILDWELSTLGDPLTDLGTVMLYWTDPGDAVVPSSDVTTAEGFPRRPELEERYAAGTGLDLSDLDFYTAYAHFKFAAIVQGVVMRSEAGAMGGQDFGNMTSLVGDTAEAGLAILNKHGA